MLFPVRLHCLSLCLLGGALLFLPGAAAGAPVFSSVSLSTDAISPAIGGFTTISYTVAVDSADVRVSLSTPGGTLVGVLLTFHRQGAGLHTVSFDGSIGGVDVSDGNYLVNVLGIDAGGPGSEQVDLPLLIDRVPPQVTTWELVSPATSVLKNGTTLTLHACVSGDPDTVFVDLSALDSNFDPSQVAASPAPPDCRLFTYTISSTNTRVDTSGALARVIARDRAGNETQALLDLCLSNTPPVILETTLLNSSPYFQDGDEIQARIRVASPYPVTVSADFQNLDSGFNPGLVQVTDLGSQTFEVRYQISDANTRDDGDYRLRLIARDPGCGETADSSLVITLDNAGQFSSLLDNVSIDVPAFSPNGNGTNQVHIRFTVLQDSTSIQIGTVCMLQNPDETRDLGITPFVDYDQGARTVTWDGNSYPAQNIPASRLKDQQLQIYIRAVSFSQGQQRTYYLPLEVDSTPPVAIPASGTIMARNGQLLNIPVRYDRPQYTITADFGGVDSQFDPGTNAPAVADSGNGRYGIFYRVSGNNTIADTTGIVVPMHAVDLAKNHTDSDLVEVCLNNHPPGWVSSRFVGKSGPFRNGDRIELETKWVTEPSAFPLKVTADFSAIDDKVTDPVDASQTASGDTVTFEVGWTLSATNQIKQGVHLPIMMTAADDPEVGCGSTTVAAAYVDLDSNKPPKPTLSAPSPVVGVSTSLLSGKALLAHDVIIEQNSEPVDTFLVDQSDSTFLGTVPLDPGQNMFTARSRDLAGNLSDPSDEVAVYFAGKTTLQIPGRFGPGDEFFLAVLEPAGMVRVRIFNLEGVELQRLESPGGSLLHIPWDGKDSTGNLIASGPCLAVVEVEDPQGRIRERLRSAFVFTRRRAGQ